METHYLIPAIARVYTQGNRLLAEANTMVSPELQRYGGYLTILDKQDGKVLMILACGIIDPNKKDKYLEFSQEKAFRLLEHFDHKTSWDSHDEAALKFPGAIKGIEAIYSFSGHQADVDEAIAISMFYLVEPGEVGFRLNNKAGKELFDYYYHDVAARNKYVKRFLHSTKLYNGNCWLDSRFDK
jgi:hypothetical protein